MENLPTVLEKLCPWSLVLTISAFSLERGVLDSTFEL